MGVAAARPGVTFLSKCWQMDGTGDQAGGTAGDEAEIAASLVVRIGKGDRAAEADLVSRYSRGLTLLLRRQTRGDLELANDVHQDTFRIVIERLRGGGIDSPERLGAYIRSTGRNVLIGVLRRRQRRGTHADTDTVQALAKVPATQQRDVEREELAAEVRLLLNELGSDRDRALLIRFYLLQQDKSVICQALQLSDLHFNRVLYRAKQRFRKIVEQSSANDPDDKARVARESSL